MTVIAGGSDVVRALVDRVVALSVTRNATQTEEASTGAGTVTGAGRAVIVVIAARGMEIVTATADDPIPIAVRPQAMSIWWMS
jgi:hypothetical protein